MVKRCLYPGALVAIALANNRNLDIVVKRLFANDSNVEDSRSGASHRVSRPALENLRIGLIDSIE